MNLYSDNDIKIAGDKPSVDVRKNKENVLETSSLDKALVKKAKAWGKDVALKFIDDATISQNSVDIDNSDMLVHRRMLLSFTATVGFEQFGGDDTVEGIAQKSFIDTLKQKSPEIYKTSEDTGAFSFYYLAFRRGGEVDRRIGQTFAMLCSHDGDPIFQELGEALYCWFLSVVKSCAKENGII